MSFSEDIYFAREVDGTFSPIVVLSGETAIPVTVTVIPMEISEALGQSVGSLRATSKHGLIKLACLMYSSSCYSSYFTIHFAGDDDFNATTVEVTFDGANSTLSVDIEIQDDFLAEGTEAFSIRLGLPSGPNADRISTGLNQSVVFIEDNDGIKKKNHAHCA